MSSISDFICPVRNSEQLVGDTWEFAFVLDSGYSYLVGTPDERVVRFAVKLNEFDADADALIMLSSLAGQGITISDDRLAEITVSSVETASLLNRLPAGQIIVQVYYTVQTTVVGNPAIVHTVDRGTFSIRKDPLTTSP